VHYEIQLGAYSVLSASIGRPSSWSSWAVRCRMHPLRTRCERAAADISHPSLSGRIPQSASRPCTRLLSHSCHSSQTLVTVHRVKTSTSNVLHLENTRQDAQIYLFLFIMISYTKYIEQSTLSIYLHYGPFMHPFVYVCHLQLLRVRPFYRASATHVHMLWCGVICLSVRLSH